jgi:hypothetical protein
MWAPSLPIRPKTCWNKTGISWLVMPDDWVVLRFRCVDAKMRFVFPIFHSCLAYTLLSTPFLRNRVHG